MLDLSPFVRRPGCLEALADISPCLAGVCGVFFRAEGRDAKWHTVCVVSFFKTQGRQRGGWCANQDFVVFPLLHLLSYISIGITNFVRCLPSCRYWRFGAIIEPTE